MTADMDQAIEQWKKDINRQWIPVPASARRAPRLKRAKWKALRLWRYGVTVGLPLRYSVKLRSPVWVEREW